MGVPLESQRDEFTGEELYTLRSEQYFLPAIELSDDELAALQTCLYLLEGQFAYSEPLRLALQNLALGRPGVPAAPSANAVRVNVLGADYTHEMPGRLSKLEAAISKQRTVRFTYWSIGRDELAERVVNPLPCSPTPGPGTWSATISIATPSACSGSRASAATSGSRRVGSAISERPRTTTHRH